MSQALVRWIVGAAIILAITTGASLARTHASEPPVEAEARPTVPRFIFTRPVVQYDGKNVRADHAWLVHDMQTGRDFLCVEGYGMAAVSP